MTEAELYKELGALTKDKGRWKESISYVSSLLTHDSVKIQAKALWLLGEMGLMYPQSVQDAVPAIAAFLNSPEPLLRERVLNALGRIGRGDYGIIEPYWAGPMSLSWVFAPMPHLDPYILSARQKGRIRCNILRASRARRFPRWRASSPWQTPMTA